MRAFLLAFVLPMSFFWGWYLLAVNDMSFGYFMLSRDMYDLVFQTYGNLLGIDPATIPPLLIRACIVDTFLILGIWAFRRRRDIAAWWSARQAAKADAIRSAAFGRPRRAVGPIHPAE